METSTIIFIGIGILGLIGIGVFLYFAFKSNKKYKNDTQSVTTPQPLIGNTTQPPTSTTQPPTSTTQPTTKSPSTTKSPLPSPTKSPSTIKPPLPSTGIPKPPLTITGQPKPPMGTGRPAPGPYETMFLY